MSIVTTKTTNPRGIPQALFVNDVEEFMSDKPEVKKVLDEFDQQYSKYKFMENNHLGRKAALDDKSPEMQRTLDAIKFLQSKKGSGEELTTKFELAETVFATAKLPADTNNVCLWLGANVMLEYTLDEAEALLTKNLDITKNQLKVLNEDLEFLREQITTMEVNVARVHNFDVKRRRQLQQS